VVEGVERGENGYEKWNAVGVMGIIVRRDDRRSTIEKDLKLKTYQISATKRKNVEKEKFRVRWRKL
jgi:hypothetical protein